MGTWGMCFVWSVGFDEILFQMGKDVEDDFLDKN